MRIYQFLFLFLLSLSIPKVSAQGLDDPAVQDYLKTIGVLPQEDKKEVKEEKAESNSTPTSSIPVKANSQKSSSNEKPPTFKEVVGKMIDDLEKKQKLNADNVANAVKDLLMNSSSKDLKPEQIKSRDEGIEKTVSEIKKLDAKGSLSAEKFKQATMDILNPNGLCAQEKEACDSTGCCEGLKCVTIHSQNPELKPGNKCLRPIKLGKSCEPFASICETGLCKAYYTNSTNLPICTPYNKACRSDNDCCSKICDNNKCNHEFRCQNCIDSGKKLKPGEKCCEGYYESLDGRCITDYPPASASVTPPKKKPFLFQLIDLIFPEAVAQTPPPDENANFDTCTFNSKRNYIKQLRDMLAKANPATPPYLMDTIESAWAFEFMALGPGVDDYWKNGAGKSIYARAKSAATKIKQNRLVTEAKFAAMDKFMLCNCIDVKGVNHPSITADQKTFFNANCANLSQTPINQILAANNIATPTPTIQTNDQKVHELDDLGIGASGIKYKEMLVRYFAARVEIQSQLFTLNGAPYQELEEIRDFLYGVDWDYFSKTTFTWHPPSVYKTLAEEAVDFLTNLIKAYYNNYFGNPEQKIQNISWNSVWNGVKNIWNMGLAPANCSETGRTWNCTWVDGSCVMYYGSTHHYSCSKEIYTPNPICGKEMPNSFCMKVTMKRTDHGSGGENRYLVDPLVPTNSSLPTDLNMLPMMNWNYATFQSWGPPTFDDTKYNNLKTLASQYARDNDFYQTQADQDSFGEYVIQKHLLDPYLANPGQAKHPTPGIIPYYENMVAKMGHMSTIVHDVIIPPGGSGGGDTDLFIKHANDYIKTVNGLSSIGKVTPGKGVLQQKSNDMMAAIKMVTFHINAMASGTTGAVKDFDQFKNGYFSGSSFGDFSNMAGQRAIAKAKQKKIYDNWMNKVGNTPRGKAMLQAKNLNGIYGAPQGIADSGNQGAPSSHSDDQANATVASADLSGNKNVSKKKSSSSGYYEGDGGGNRRRGQSEENLPAEETVKEALAEIKSENYQPINQDTLFQIVSKAYARGAYPVLLYGQPGIPLNKDPSQKPELVIDDEHVFAPTKSPKRKAPSSPAPISN